MIATAMSCTVQGITGVPVTVEADVAGGLPQFTIVGLTDRAIQEARERVRAAIRNSGFSFPEHRVTVNLAPAEVPKEGTGFDLAIALAVLGISMNLPLRRTACIAELALDGRSRGVVGMLPMARCLAEAGIETVLVAAENAAEAALVDGIRVIGVDSLAQTVAHLQGSVRLSPVAAGTMGDPEDVHGDDLGSIRGQAAAKRALEIAAAGGHNLLMLGPPGAGKTMLARAVRSLLPDLEPEPALEVAAVYSLRGRLADRPATSLRPPFRAPHHSISRAGLVGGGQGFAQPGEISLAHQGVLFLDEICEFPRPHLEALRQPLEERRVTIARVRGAVSFPAEFMLVAAANPCPCGQLGSVGSRSCHCPEEAVARYQARLSGPMRDRIDLAVHVPRLESRELFDGPPEEATRAVRARVEAARHRQVERSAAAGVVANVRLAGGDLLRVSNVEPKARALLTKAGERYQLSARAYHRVLRVSRTIADLAGDERVGRDAVLEALRHRGEAA